MLPETTEAVGGCAGVVCAAREIGNMHSRSAATHDLLNPCDGLAQVIGVVSSRRRNRRR
jgi:hypothetical protein